MENKDMRLIDASRAGDIGRVKVLIKAGADVNAVDLSSWTALRNATFRGYTEIARLLVKAGADVNAVTNDGKTVLMCAESYGSNYIVKLLIAAGAR